MQLKRLLLLVALGVLCVTRLDGQKLPPRDAANSPDDADTGTIRGRVIAADTLKPIFGASVSLAWVPTESADSMPISSRQTVTNTAGVFEFTSVPPGSYRLLALPGPLAPQYVRIGYGGQRPIGDRSVPVDVAAGHTTEGITIALPRGGVISGTVTDDFAAPLAQAEIVALWFAGPGSRGQRFDAPVKTDDSGHYLVYGLLPGEYVVLATPLPDDSSAGGAQRLPGLVSTYYPGTPDYGTAQRVRVAEGRETLGIDFRLARSRTYSIAGIVTDSQGRPLVGAEGRLVPRMSVSFGGAVDRFVANDRGEFVLNRVQPGQYHVAVRESSVATAAGTTRDPEVTTVPVEVTAADVERMVIATTPAVTVSGQIVFEPEPPKTLPSTMRVFAEGFDTNAFVWPAQPGVVRPDLSFTMTGLMSECMLRIVVPGWFVKSVTLNGEDITDVLRQFAPGDRVSILLTMTGSTLEGTVTTPDGQPATNGAVIMFAEDRSGWTTTSVRMRRARLESGGKFKIVGLLPGRYYIVAGSRERVLQPGYIEPSYFEAFAKDATTIVIGEREQRTIALTMSR
jgi:Carboxypeptidase regulatory-like domain